MTTTTQPTSAQAALHVPFRLGPFFRDLLRPSRTAAAADASLARATFAVRLDEAALTWTTHLGTVRTTAHAA